MEDPWQELRHEIDRSRRHQHPASVLRIAHSRAAGDRRSERRNRRDMTMIVDRLRSVLRSIDAVWMHRDGVFALLPETDRAAAEQLVARLRREMAELLPASGVDLACFPEDGVTANALRESLERTAQESVRRGIAKPAAGATFEIAKTERS